MGESPALGIRRVRIPPRPSGPDATSQTARRQLAVRGYLNSFDSPSEI